MCEKPKLLKNYFRSIVYIYSITNSPMNLFENFTETSRNELCDQEMLTALRNDERVDKKTRVMLTSYSKRMANFEVEVSYRLTDNVSAFNLARLYGNGIQGLKREYRTALTYKNYFELDMENAHYNIANAIAQKLGLKHEKIDYYCKNRDYVLSLISSNRAFSKLQLLKIAYGGECCMDDHDFQIYDNVSGFIYANQNAITFLDEIKNEMTTLANHLWMMFSHLHKIKRKGIAIKDTNNKQFRLLSYILQTEERRILYLIDESLRIQGRSMDVLIFDGGLVRRMNGEVDFPEDIIRKCVDYIRNNSIYDVPLAIKKMENTYVPPSEDNTQSYERMKINFEKNNFLVGAKLCCILDNGHIEYYSMGDAKVKFSNWIVKVYEDDKMKEKAFIDLWNKDPQRKQYNRIDFYPKREVCPDGVYNLFDGMKAEKLGEGIVMSDEEKADIVAPIIRHLDLITGGNANYLLKWFAHIIQKPNVKTEIAPLLRDMGGLFVEGGGTGKNMLIDWFGYEILGDKLYSVIGNNEELYDKFTSQFEGKLLIFVEEAHGNSNFGNKDYLKSQITSKKQTVNKKNVAKYDSNDYRNYIFASNNRNPIPISNGDRRFAVFDVNPEMRGNADYFTELQEHLSRDYTKVAFYQYLLNYETFKTPIEFYTKMPITKAYIDIRNANAPLYLKWIAELVKTNTLTNDTVKSLYEKFCHWISRTNERADATKPTMTAFGYLLNDASDHGYDVKESFGDKVKSRTHNNSMYMNWNREAILRGLKKLYLIPEDFVMDTSIPLLDDELDE